MKPTLESPCIEWGGSESRYQQAAAKSLAVEGADPSPYAWITPKCGNAKCIEPDHLTVHKPVRLAYPYGVCIYCGRPGWTKDHLFPRRWTGDALRKFTAVVPACGTCNSLLGDTLTWSITERRMICHARLRKHYRKTLRTKDFSAGELREFQGTLRAYIKSEMVKKREVLAMLEWPTDPSYDLRALEHSGLEDPYVLGLILAEHDLVDLVRGAE